MSDMKSKEQIIMEALQHNQKMLNNLSQLNEAIQQKMMKLNNGEQISNNNINEIKSIHQSFQNSQQFSLICNVLSFTDTNSILNSKIYEYSQIITKNLDDLITQEMNPCVEGHFVPGNNNMNIEPGNNNMISYPDSDEYDYSESSGDEDYHYDRIQNKIFDKPLQNLCFMLMMQWPLHLFPQEIHYKYEQLFNEKINVSLNQIMEYKDKMMNDWIKYDYQTLTIDASQYLKVIPEKMRQNIIKKKFIKIMNTLHPNGVISHEISNIFKYFIGICPTQQQIEYGTDLCDKTLNTLKLKSIYQQNIHIDNDSTINRHVLSYEEMIACGLYGFYDGIAMSKLQHNLQRYFQLDIDLSRPYYQALLYELVDPCVRKRDNKYLLGWKSRNRLSDLLCWWQTIIINHDDHIINDHSSSKIINHYSSSKPLFSCKDSVIINNLSFDTEIIKFICWMEGEFNVKIVNQGILRERAGTFCITIVLQNAEMVNYLKQQSIYYENQRLQIESAVPTKSLK